MEKDLQSRKYQITINNPIKKGLNHNKIKEIIKEIKSCIYYCMSDEIGKEENTPHTHIYIACSSPVRFSTIKNRFPLAHIESARGTSEQNRDYVFKLGKHEEEKGETKIPNAQEEWGEIPTERQGARNDIYALYDMIKTGMSDYEIFEANPKYILFKDTIEKVRQTFRQNEYNGKTREVEVTYIYGKPGTGKTLSIMNKYGFENVYRVTSYVHGGFDSYKGQDAIVFEEFSSSLKIQDMLNYLDCYPLELPCRYANKIACFTKIYIISNVPLFSQYKDIQANSPDTWQALLRRIHNVIEYYDFNVFNKYSLNEYIKLQMGEE